VTFIDLQVGHLSARVKLAEQLAPKTCEAVLAALPFGGRAVHVQVSGEMFRMLDHAPLPDLAVEAPTTFQHPGSLIYYPKSHEIAICYGQARFSGHHGPIDVTPLGEVEADPDQLRALGAMLTDSGVLPIDFRLAADQDSPFAPAAPVGPTVNFSYGGASTKATLLTGRSPITSTALAELFPIEADFVADVWGGQSAHARLDSGPGSNGEADTRLLWPGYVYYSPDRCELTFCYGNAALNGPRADSPVVPVLALADDWQSGVLPQALDHLTQGKRPAKLTSG
jgi:hypothetical protein